MEKSSETTVVGDTQEEVAEKSKNKATMQLPDKKKEGKRADGGFVWGNQVARKVNQHSMTLSHTLVRGRQHHR